MDILLLPGIQHLLTESIRTERGNVVDGKCAGIGLARNIDGSV